MEQGSTALHMACRYGHYEMTKVQQICIALSMSD